MHCLDSALLIVLLMFATSAVCVCVVCVPLSWDTAAPQASQWLLQHTLAAGRGQTGRLTDLQKLERLLIFDCSLGYAKKDNTRTQSHTALHACNDVG